MYSKTSLKAVEVSTDEDPCVIAKGLINVVETVKMTNVCSAQFYSM